MISQNFPQALVLRWELNAKTTNRSLLIEAGRDTTQPVGNRHEMHSTDDLGDPTAVPFKGPAIDNEESVFLMRRLPLAVGYKTKLPVTAQQVVPSQMELAVTGIEAVQTPAGKFNCYKISFAAIGQTFWIGAEASRPLVKFQSGNVEAELVKAWGEEDVMKSALGFVAAAGWKLNSVTMGPGPEGRAQIGRPGSQFESYVNVWMRKIYTPQAEIAASLRKALDDEVKQRQRDASPYYHDYQARPGSVQERLIGGKQALSCIVDYIQQAQDHFNTKADYLVWIRTESTFIQFIIYTDRDGVGVARWQIDSVLATAKIP